MLSALGLVLSEHRRDVVESVLLGGADADAGEPHRRGGAARRRAPATSWATPGAELRVTYELRYAGQAFELPVEAAADAAVTALRRAFDQAHETRYGYRDEEAELELVTVRVTAATPGPEPRPSAAAGAAERGTRRIVFAGDELEARVLGPGEAQLEGPAVFELDGLDAGGAAGLARRSADADAVILERAA